MKKSDLNSFETILDHTVDFFQSAKKILQINDSVLEQKEEAFNRVLLNRNDKQLKIAITGVIKSGKSTFVNSLLKKGSCQKRFRDYHLYSYKNKKREKKQSSSLFKIMG